MIDSLSAGYRYLGWRLYLLLIPVLLDLLLWRGPQLSVAPLFARLANTYQALAGWQNIPPDLRSLFEQAAQSMNETGQNSNLLDLLMSSSLLQVPSLLPLVGSLSGSGIRQITSLWAVAGLSTLISVAGLLLGVFYLHGLAQTLPIGVASKNSSWRQDLRMVLRQWLLLLVFVIFAFGGLLLLLAMVSVLLALVALLSPAIGSFLGFLFAGMLLVIGIYLYFVPAGLIMDDLTLFNAIVQSFRLVRDNFAASVGLILLTQLINLGMTLLLERLFAYQTAGILAAIVINAYIGSGLALGLLVFYRSRLLMAEGRTVSYEL